MSYKFLKASTVVATESTNSHTISSPTTAETGAYTCVVTISGVDSVASSSHSMTFVGKSTTSETILMLIWQGCDVLSLWV